jgi:FG-GAP-like repeat/ASPIC and UnbV
LITALALTGCQDSVNRNSGLSEAQRKDGQPSEEAVLPDDRQIQADPSLGTKKMAELLKALEENSDLTTNVYLNHRRAEEFRSAALREPDLWRLPDQRFKLARELLYSGNCDDALAEIEGIESDLKEKVFYLDSVAQREIQKLKSMTLLRLAEQENCCALHSQDSCFVPIRGEGIHKLRRGSEGAIEVLSQLLKSDPYDLGSRWLLNIAYMTLDEYPQGVPPDYLIAPSAFESENDIGRFCDVAKLAGLEVVGIAGGTIMEDFDGDGQLDLMCSSMGMTDQLRLFRSNGDGTFSENTQESGLTGIVGGLNICHADYDNDGDADVLVLRGGWYSLFADGRFPNSLLRNNGDGTFDDVTEAAGILSYHPTQTAAWGDYDNDGWIDLFIGNESNRSETHPCELFRNNGDGTFRECALEAGVAHEGFIKGVAFGDYDNDGFSDLYLSNGQGPNVLFHNEGNGLFTDVTEKAGVAEPQASFPCWFFDFDNDGWQDIFVCGYGFEAPVNDVVADLLNEPHSGELPRLYRNRGDGTFQNVARETNLNRFILAMGSNFGDLDNDGWLDMYLATGDPDFRTLVPNRAFRNANGGTFQDVTTSGGLGNIQKGHGVAFGDMDNDGDQDMFVKMGGAYEGDVYHSLLFENPGHGNHWITLILNGVRSNRLGIGARIRVDVESNEGTRQIHLVAGTGGSFGSSSLQQEIGLGHATSISMIEVYWPASGIRQQFRDVAMDSVYVVREGGEDLQPVERKRWTIQGEPGPNQASDIN